LKKDHIYITFSTMDKIKILHINTYSGLIEYNQ
jgi:hypothetical protein